MKESEFQRTVIELARTCHWKVAHFRPVKQLRADGTTRYLTPVQADGVGFPDLILLRGSRGIAWELKSDRGVAKPEQVEWLKAFGAAGFEVGVVFPMNWDYVERTLTSPAD